MPQPILRGRSLPAPLLLLGVAVVYAALAELVLHLNDPVSAGAGFWPATGFVLGTLVLVGPRRWGWVLVGVVVGELGVDIARGYPLLASLWWAAGNVVGPLVGALALRRVGNPDGHLVPLGPLGRFLVAAVLVGPLVGATVGTVGSAVVIGSPGWWETWPRYIVGDGLGVLVVAPVLLCWRQDRVRCRRAERAALAVAVPLVTLVAFGGWAGDWSLPYMVIPPLSWAALRHGIRGGALAVFAAAQIANWATATGSGPFAVGGDHATTRLQLFLAIVAMTTFAMAALAEDVVDRAVAERRLTRQAVTDSLTGLPNRSALALSLGTGIGSRSARAKGVGVFVCDLDHFKVVNDGLGHHAGDEVLVEVARRMRRCVRPGDLVARLGGDEFVVVMDTPVTELDEMAHRLVGAVARPMTLSDGTTLTPSLSVGIAHCEPGVDPTDLLREADTALYRAKDLGRGRFHHFDEQLRALAVDRLVIQTELQVALDRGDLTCAYQPEIALATGQLFCFEALARWDHAALGTISPARFIPIVEATGASGQLYRHVLDQALGAQAEWAGHLGTHPAVAVNVSARQLDGSELVETTRAALARRGAPPASLWIEVTESALADEGTTEALTALHALGVRLAIDDFGTGWSSTARLASFPWDLLKIDRSFVDALCASHHAEQVVRSTIAMAHALGIATTAEGVETAEQLERLADLGCDNAQGFFIARPGDAVDAIAQVGADGGWAGPGGRARLA